jgi:hypothetical protein
MDVGAAAGESVPNELSALRSETYLSTDPDPDPDASCPSARHASNSLSSSLHHHARPFIADCRAPTVAADPHDALAKMQANYRNYPQQHMAPARRGPGT